MDWSAGCEWEGGRVCRYGEGGRSEVGIFVHTSTSVANVWVINFACAMNMGDLRL